MNRMECYGEMFPEILWRSGSVDRRGKVFNFCSEVKGLAPPEATVDYDPIEWEDCLNCADFDSCYKLSNAKVLLFGVVNER